MPTGTWLVVGLGNPGPIYALHRHNVGHMVVDELARRTRTPLAGARGMRADVCQTRVTGTGIGGVSAEAVRVVLAKPRTYMNESGGPVAALMAYHKIGPAQLVVLHDELDLALGQLRLKRGGGDNGHNGLRSIRATLRTGDFFRVRMGIGRPPGRQEPADYVLSNFRANERADVEVAVGRSGDAVETLIFEDLSVAQNRFNS